MSLEVHNDEKERKFYALVDGHEARIGYAKVHGVYNLLHTFVPEELRGHGVADQLVLATLEMIKAEGAKFIPTCPYVQAFLQRHPEWAPHTSKN
ncbi:MAG TPA: GNAT family N-acetyltransferase [Thermoanaerobaculia bacterium]|nr:GNAT family N-acetyltransferase [Thermoanaerobaculia bacterium]